MLQTDLFISIIQGRNLRLGKSKQLTQWAWTGLEPPVPMEWGPLFEIKLSGDIFSEKSIVSLLGQRKNPEKENMLESFIQTTDIYWAPTSFHGFSPWLHGKEYACDAGDAREEGSIPESGRPPGGGHGNPLQYFCLKNPMDIGAASP